MTASVPPLNFASSSGLSACLDEALARIPPLWPLRHFVAVNPFVGLAGHSFEEAGALLQRTVGAAPLLSPAEYLKAWREGRISKEDLASVCNSEWTVQSLVCALETAKARASSRAIATVADLLDRERPRAHWSVFVVEEISKWCAVSFDENQTTWNSPWKELGLFEAWREAALLDHNPEAFGLVGFRSFVRTLPSKAEACIERCLELLSPEHVALEDFLHRQLATIAGWAGHVQYRVREDALRGRANPALKELLAIRLAYDAALFCAFGRDEVFRSEWRHMAVPEQDTRLLAALVRWQSAYETGYQRSLAAALCARPVVVQAARPAVQAVFCIDVRSEIFRRHLEAAHPDLQTLGFAGFFGFPVQHHPEAASGAAHCPVLLVPPVETCEPQPAELASRLREHRGEARAWKAFQNSAGSCFSFVESAGLAFGASLLGGSTKPGPLCSRVAPGFVGTDLASRAAMAEGALRNMGLTRGHARLVLLCGHGSRSANNPQASSLDCGACGGHAGDVNARLAAATLNDPQVRAVLALSGISLPGDTLFVSGIHNTATDEVELPEAALVPASHHKDLAALRSALAAAGAGCRNERAPLLGLGGTARADLKPALRSRASDISQVRPEWALANNAALLAAPRSRSKGLNLAGRVFLHDYDASSDTDDKVLTLILSAPVVVASWINLQYYASRVDPVRYGSGDKVLHNVVGGLGVFEGNGGDLKVGLPLQSLHDGTKFVHEPRRLSVFIEAPRERIFAVLQKLPGVRTLFDKGWIHLFAIEGSRCFRYAAGGAAGDCWKHWAGIPVEIGQGSPMSI